MVRIDRCDVWRAHTSRAEFTGVGCLLNAVANLDSVRTPRLLDSLGNGNFAVTTYDLKLSSVSGLPSFRVPTDAQPWGVWTRAA